MYHWIIYRFFERLQRENNMKVICKYPINSSRRVYKNTPLFLKQSHIPEVNWGKKIWQAD